MTFHIIYQKYHCRFCIIIRCFLPLRFSKYAFLCIHGFYHPYYQHFHKWENKEKIKHFFSFLFIFPFTINQWQVLWLIHYCVNCTLPPSLWTLFYVPDIYNRFVILSSLKIDYFTHQTFSFSIFYSLLQSLSDYYMFFTKCTCMIQP